MIARIRSWPPAPRLAAMALAALALLAVAWAILWQVGAWWLDRAVGNGLADASGQGLVVLCPEREVGGFPSAFDLSCRNAVLRSGDLRAQLSGLSARASLGRPGTALAVLMGPAAIERPGQESDVALDWTSLMFSARAGWRGFERAAVTAQDLSVSSGGDSLALAGLGAELARGGDGSALKAVLRRAVPVLGGAALPPVDGTASARLNVPPVQLVRGASPGLRVSDIVVELASGATQLLASGEVSVGPERLLDGRLTVQLAGVEELPALLATLPEKPRALANAAAGAVMAVGRPITLEGRPAREVVVDIRRGTVRVGFLALGQVPPL